MLESRPCKNRLEVRRGSMRVNLPAIRPTASSNTACQRGTPNDHAVAARVPDRLIRALRRPPRSSDHEVPLPS
jgi:hypothetical protein